MGTLIKNNNGSQLKRLPLFALVVPLLLSIDSFAGPSPKLLNSAIKEDYHFGIANYTQMSRTGLADFQGFRRFVVSEQERGTSSIRASYGDRFTEALSPKKINGQNSGVVQQMEVSDNGDVVRTAFTLPETFEAPKTIEFASPGIGGGDGIASITAVKRTFDDPFSDKDIVFNQTFMVRNIEGQPRPFRVTLASEVSSDKGSAYATIVSNHIHTREINVMLSRQDPTDQMKTLYLTGGTFKLPEDIKGEVVDLNINAAGTRLTFKTSEGMEYEYSIEKNPEKGIFRHHTLAFKNISSKKIPGGIKSLVAEAKVIPGRRSSAKTPVAGMEVEDAAGSK